MVSASYPGPGYSSLDPKMSVLEINGKDLYEKC